MVSNYKLLIVLDAKMTLVTNLLPLKGWSLLLFSYQTEGFGGTITLIARSVGRIKTPEVAERSQFP